MLKTRFVPAAAVALLSLAHGSLHAQGAKQTVELAFGYECGDRFLVRNDGSQAVVIEYAIAGSQDKSQLHLNAKQSAEIASAQSGDMQLWVSGKVVATEPKGNRACRGAAQNSDGVVVRPLDQTNSADMASAETTEPGYSAPPVVVYGDYYPYYYPSYYGYYGYGYPSYGFGTRIGIGFGRGIGGIGRGRPVGRGRGRR